MKMEVSPILGSVAWLCFLTEPNVEIQFETDTTTGDLGTHNVPQVISKGLKMNLILSFFDITSLKALLSLKSRRRLSRIVEVLKFF